MPNDFLLKKIKKSSGKLSFFARSAIFMQTENDDSVYSMGRNFLPYTFFSRFFPLHTNFIFICTYQNYTFLFLADLRSLLYWINLPLATLADDLVLRTASRPAAMGGQNACLCLIEELRRMKKFLSSDLPLV